MISKEVLNECSKLYHLSEQVRDISVILNERVTEMNSMVKSIDLASGIDIADMQENVKFHIQHLLWSEFERNIPKKQVTVVEE